MVYIITLYIYRHLSYYTYYTMIKYNNVPYLRYTAFLFVVLRVPIVFFIGCGSGLDPFWVAELAGLEDPASWLIPFPFFSVVI